MQRIVIVYGSNGVGKSSIAEALARALELRLVDEWNGREPVAPGSLVVTNLEPVPAVPGALYVQMAKGPHTQGQPVAIVRAGKRGRDADGIAFHGVRPLPNPACSKLVAFLQQLH